MQVRPKSIAIALAAIAIAAVPLIGGHTDKAVAAPPGAPAWAIQPGGTLAFAVANGSDTIGAKFAKWGGTIAFDPDSPGTAAIHIDVDLASASIGDNFKDELLQGDEFFGTSSTPTATYDSQSVEAQPDGRFLAHGTLKLRGMSMPQDVEFRLSGSGGQRHVDGTASIDRVGFGIGTVFHEDPQVLHYGRPGNGLELQKGMIFTIEPMINAGRREIRTMPDQWTVKTKDRSLSAQWEHTVLVTDAGYDVLTVSAGTPARPSIAVAA